MQGIVESSAGGFKFPDGSFQLNSASGDGHSLNTADNTLTDVVYVNNQGNVGIGTTAPNAGLDILGTLEIVPAAYYYTRADQVLSVWISPRCSCDTSTQLIGSLIGGLNCADAFYTNLDQEPICYDWYTDMIFGAKSRQYIKSAIVPAAISVSKQGNVVLENIVRIGGELNVGTSSGDGVINASTNADFSYLSAIHGRSENRGSGVKGTSVQGVGIYGSSENSYAGDFSGPVRASGVIEANGGIQIPLSNYTVDAVDTAIEQTVVTATHNFCALTNVKMNSYDPGTYKWCQVRPNGNGTWTLAARGATGVVTCDAYCF